MPSEWNEPMNTMPAHRESGARRSPLRRVRMLMAALLMTGPALSVSAMAGGSCPGAPGAPPGDALQTLQSDVLQLNASVQQAFEALPFEEFEVHARQVALGEDPEVLFAWVRDHTTWLPYEGTLRGARGVLMDRMGSSLDRALLLADLLESAGHTVQLARAELAPEQAAALIRTLQERGLPAAQRPVFSAADVHDAAQQAAERHPLDATVLRQDFDRQRQSAEHTHRRLLEQVEVQGQMLQASLQDAAAESAAVSWQPTQHWWVQIRSRDGWDDLDPALPGHRAGDRLVSGPAQATVWPDEIPEAFQHRLTIAVIAEQLRDGRLHEHVALEHEVPASALAVRQIRVETFPVSLPDMDAMLGFDDRFDRERLPQMILEETEWMPLLRVGEQLISDKSILSDGTAQEQLGRTPQAAALHQASGLLGQISAGRRGDDAVAPELVAVQLRLTVTAPGRDPEVLQRPVVDILGPGLRQHDPGALEVTDALRAERAAGLLGTTQIAGQVAWMPWSLMTGLGYQALLAERLAGLGTVHALRSERPGLMDSVLEQLDPRREPLDQFLHLRHVLSAHPEAIALTRLNLVGYVHLVALDAGVPTVREGFDILQNRIAVPARSAATSPESVADAATIRIAQGVLDTLLEAELIAPEGTLGNTARTFADARMAGVPWRKIADPDQRAELTWTPDPDLEALWEAAFEAGNVLVVPSRIPEGIDPVWWQLNPVSGSVLGMGPDGRGQGVEAILILMNSIDNAVAAAGMAQTIWACLLNHDTASGMSCCVEGAAITAAVSRYMSKGLADHAALGGWVITGGNRLFDMLNNMAVGKIAGAVTDGFMDTFAPEPQC